MVVRSTVWQPPRVTLRWALPVGTALGLLAVSELLSRTGVVSPRAIPPVTDALAAFVRLVRTEELWRAVGTTLQAWAIGVTIAAVLGIVAGLAIGGSQFLYRSVRGVIEFLRPVPEVAALPLIVLLVGTGVEMIVVLVVAGALWPMLFQALYGVQDLNPVMRDTARAYRLGPWTRFAHMTLPGATPYIATGLRLAAVGALKITVAAGLIVGAPGLGSAILDARNADHIDEMYALILVTALLGLTITFAFKYLERWTLRWHPTQRGVA